MAPELLEEDGVVLAYARQVRMVSGRTKAHELERLLPWARKAEQLVATVDA